jgi:hypothetical protein
LKLSENRATTPMGAVGDGVGVGVFVGVVPGGVPVAVLVGETAVLEVAVGVAGQPEVESGGMVIWRLAVVGEVIFEAWAVAE